MAINRNLSILAQGASSTGNLLNYTGANKIINGDMMIDQRNAGASVATSAVARLYNLDRWCAYTPTGSGHTVQQVTDAPTGYKNSLKITIGTGATPGASAPNYIAQFIEGNQVTDLGFGGAGAKTIAVSFWVKSSVTGTFTAPIFNGAYTRSYLATYVVSVANTWEQKSIIIPGDTSGTWVLTSSTGFVIQFDLGSGTSLQNTAGGWYNTEYDGATGATRIITTSGATIQWTGVKIEVGSVATPFVPDDYQVLLGKCYRYGYRWTEATTNIAIANGAYYNTVEFDCMVKFPVTMRGAPTMSQVSGTNYWQIDINGADTFDAWTSFFGANAKGGMMYVASGVSGTTGAGGWIRCQSASAYVFFDAEL